MSQSQPRLGTALQEFFDWESTSKVPIISPNNPSSPAQFLPLSSLKAYFSSNDYATLHALLSEVFESDFPPVDPEFVIRDHAAIFCILLHLGEGKLIEYYARFEELSDRRLPFEREHPPRDFLGDDGGAFLGEFCGIQQAYCVPVFDAHMLHKHFGGQRLLPITNIESRGKDGLAETYVVQVYEPYNKLFPTADLHAPGSNKFMLKIYRSDGEEHYREEVNGFRAVRNTENIIKFHGSYIHGDTFNILLEYADKGTLEDFFQKEPPPSRGLDIIGFWEALFQLIQGLKVIHSVRGYHGDVAPRSILVVSNEAKSRFKFAQFGRKIPGASSTGIENGENAYVAPELFGKNTSAVNNDGTCSWSSDIWSLGCIYSEAAMWIADGYKGIMDFRSQRVQDICFPGTDSFHDGSQVLQSILDAHRDIEDRLRRSDFITKDVLDSMVDEMLWEEDRPTAKALCRKAEMVISRVRTKMLSNSPPEISRPASRQRGYPPPPFQPPTQPLPQIPRALAASLSPISEQQHPRNVENWRSQIHLPCSPTENPTPESISNLDRELNGSIASWQMRDNNSQASPITPFTSPHVSLYFDHNRHSPNEGRPRAVPHSFSQEDHRPNGLSRTLSNTLHPQELYLHPRYPTMVNEEEPLDVSSAQTVAEMRTRARAASRAGSSRQSSYSIPTASSPTFEPLPIQIPVKSEKRGPSLSLFPPQSYQHSPPPEETHPALRTPPYTVDSIPRSVQFVENTDVLESSRDRKSTEYLSIDTYLDWKKTHKKTKKSKIPPLPGAHLLSDLQERDHIFIVDDSSSMAPHWPDLKRTFEALSHLTKGMSPDGTELFYTISYDTYRRKDPSDLSAYLETKPTTGETNIAYRINLQLQAYRAKIINSRAKKVKKGQKESVRPMSIYILTNGEWRGGRELKGSLREMATFLKTPGMEKQLMVEFITFAESSKATQRFNDLAIIDFGLDFIDWENWDGNLWRMVRGALDRERFPRREVIQGKEGGDERSSISTSQTSTWTHGRVENGVINELA